jgi:hypothetical protein
MIMKLLPSAASITANESLPKERIMISSQHTLQSSDDVAEQPWPFVLPWPSSVHGWTRAILIAAVGLALIAMTRKYRTELEVAYGVHGMRAMTPPCQTIELRHEEEDVYLLNCTDSPSWIMGDKS